MAAEAGCTLVALIASVHSVVHWSTQGGYNFISGPLADITILTAFLSTLYLFLTRSAGSTTPRVADCPRTRSRRPSRSPRRRRPRNRLPSGVGALAERIRGPDERVSSMV
jgi:hypothetical protein